MGKRIAMTLMAALAAMSAPSFVRAKDDPAVVIPTGDQAMVQRAIDHRQMIYAYDQAAWHGTDDLMAKAKAGGMWDALAPRLGGWIVDGSASEPVLTFFDKSPDPRAIYTARFADGGTRLVDSKLLGEGDDRTISAARQRLIAAQRTAREALAAAKVARCSDANFNTVVLPPSEPGGSTLVYFLTPQTANNVWPIGGHYLIEVGADGKAGDVRAFTKACLDLSPKGGETTPVAMTVSHLLDPVPTEIHVFTMLTTRLPLYVVTIQNNRIWAIDVKDGRPQIRLAGKAK